MPQIHFKKNRPPLDVALGENLMKTLLDAGVPVASSCQGVGVCGKCKIQVIEGWANLSKPTDDELFLMEKNNIGKNFRISCQSIVLGDITIDTGYW